MFQVVPFRSPYMYKLYISFQARVAPQLNVHQTIIYHLCSSLHNTWSSADRPRQCVTMPRRDCHTRLKHLRDRFPTAIQTTIITQGTYNNRILWEVIFVRKLFTLVHPLHRIEGSFAWLDLSVIERRLFIGNSGIYFLFSDESRYCWFRVEERKRVHIRRGERFTDICVIERGQFRSSSVMVWGSNAYNFKSLRVIIDGNLIAVKNRNEILQPYSANDAPTRLHVLIW